MALLGLVRALTLIGQVALYIQVNSVIVGLNAEYRIGKAYLSSRVFSAIFYDRYLHHFTRIIVEFFAPGTAPLTTMTFCSGRILTTRRFVTFTRSLPMRPARRLPFMTREAKEALPIEPGARSLLCWPWVCSPTPLNPWRLTTPWNPFPLEVPTTST